MCYFESICTFQSAPYLMDRKRPEDGKPLVGNERYEGFSADMAEKVAETVGFDYIIRLVRDQKYGEKITDGTWNGMVGELTQRVCNFT